MTAVVLKTGISGRVLLGVLSALAAVLARRVTRPVKTQTARAAPDLQLQH